MQPSSQDQSERLIKEGSLCIKEAESHPLRLGTSPPVAHCFSRTCPPSPVLRTALRAFTCPTSQHPQFGLDSAAALNHRHRLALRGILTLRKHTTSHPEQGERYQSELGERQLSDKGVNVLLQVAQHAWISQARQCRRESGSWLQLPGAYRVSCTAQPKQQPLAAPRSHPSPFSGSPTPAPGQQDLTGPAQ